MLLVVIIYYYIISGNTDPLQQQGKLLYTKYITEPLSLLLPGSISFKHAVEI